MESDLLTRLRERLRYIDVVYKPDKLCIEAADEIARITARVAELEAALRPFAIAAPDRNDKTFDRAWEVLTRSVKETTDGRS